MEVRVVGRVLGALTYYLFYRQFLPVPVLGRVVGRVLGSSPGGPASGPAARLSVPDGDQGCRNQTHHLRLRQEQAAAYRLLQTRRQDREYSVFHSQSLSPPLRGLESRSYRFEIT